MNILNTTSLLFIQIGQPQVCFIDRRVNFGQVPLHLTTSRTAMLKNTGLCHAYFQVRKLTITIMYACIIDLLYRCKIRTPSPVSRSLQCTVWFPWAARLS